MLHYFYKLLTGIIQCVTAFYELLCIITWTMNNDNRTKYKKMKNYISIFPI